MPDYRVIVEETISNEFILTANSKEEAMRIAETKYENCEYIVYPECVTSKKMAVLESDYENAEWVKF